LTATKIAGTAADQSASSVAVSSSGSYSVHNIVSDSFVRADHTDSDLVNPWGIVFNPNGFAWIADGGKGVSTFYDGSGVKNGVVRVPVPPGGVSPSKPTGIVFSSGSDFVVASGGHSGPSRFLFATEDGTISGWAPDVDAARAILAVNNAGSGAIYKGLALAANGTGHLLYATDFHNNRVDVFDSSFHPVTLSGTFSDPRLPPRYAPFGIQNVLGNLYVTYAKQDEDAEDDVAGDGFGYVDVFNADGQLLRRFASRGALNAPWGVALAPGDCGRFSNTLLIGNFGNGRITAFDLASREFQGQLHKPNGHMLIIDGLWGLAFGNGLLSQPTGALFFTAGPDDEMHGIYGRIDPAP
jgi:uncharacterized protein (TIGR03118 family)